MRILIIIGAILSVYPSSGQKTIPVLQESPFLTFVADEKDNLRTVMSDYALEVNDCNRVQFQKLNRFRPDDYTLTAGRTYKLPIQTLAYNGKSIRSTLGISDWKTAKALSDYNHQVFKKGTRTDNFIESKVLWVPWHFFNCEEEDAPDEMVAAPLEKVKTVPVSGFGGEPNTGSDASPSYPIFGPQYAKTPLASTRLQGKVFYLISGHGGPDPGARGKRAGTTLCEDEYAYDVTLRLLRFLLSHGATAYMIVRDDDGIRDDNYLKCDKDEVVWGNKAIPLGQKERLGQRTDIINSLTELHRKKGQTDQTIIEIHIDSRSKATETDVFFYYRANSEASKGLAKKMQTIFSQKYNQKRGPSRRYSGEVSTRDLFTLRETVAPKAVYIELANIQNDWDQQRIVLKNNRQALANWLGQAIMKK